MVAGGGILTIIRQRCVMTMAARRDWGVGELSDGDDDDDDGGVRDTLSGI